MGKEIISNKADNKRQIITECIKRGVEEYLFENFDIYKSVSITAILVSDDLRTVKIYVCFSEKNEEDNLLKLLNRQKHKVVDIIKKIMTTKYFPKINFYKGEDGDLVF